MPRRNSQSGFSLIEVLVAFLVVSIGLVGLAGMQLVGLKGNQQSFTKNQAAHHTQALLERMRANPAAAINGDYNKTMTAASCASAPGTNCNAPSSICNATQVAAYDVYQTFCGLSNTVPGGIMADLSQSQLSISCPVDCRSGVSIELNWTEQVLGREDASAVARQLSMTTRISE